MMRVERMLCASSSSMMSWSGSTALPLLQVLLTAHGTRREERHDPAQARALEDAHEELHALLLPVAVEPFLVLVYLHRDAAVGDALGDELVLAGCAASGNPRRCPGCRR